jgi:hypothetical protein
MSVQQEPSVEELRRESERTRMALTATVAQIKERVGDASTDLKAMLSPPHVKQEIKEYVQGHRAGLIASIQRRAKENPLLAVGIGAALMYPAWSLFRAIPTPLMLIGAGLYFSGKRGNSEPARVQGQTQRGSETADADAAAGGVGDATRGNNSGDRATGPKQHDLQTRATSFVDENPLLIAGAGAAIGAFIAAALPSSDAENRLFGAGNAKVRSKARQAAREGIDKARDYVSQKTDSIVAAAEREGLGANGVGQAVENVGDGLRAVVDRGLNALAGETQQHGQQSKEMSERSTS